MRGARVWLWLATLGSSASSSAQALRSCVFDDGTSVESVLQTLEEKVALLPSECADTAAFQTAANGLRDACAFGKQASESLAPADATMNSTLGDVRAQRENLFATWLIRGSRAARQSGAAAAGLFEACRARGSTTREPARIFTETLADRLALPQCTTVGNEIQSVVQKLGTRPAVVNDWRNETEPAVDLSFQDAGERIAEECAEFARSETDRRLGTVEDFGQDISDGLLAGGVPNPNVPPTTSAAPSPVTPAGLTSAPSIPAGVDALTSARPRPVSAQSRLDLTFDDTGASLSVFDRLSRRMRQGTTGSRGRALSRQEARRTYEHALRDLRRQGILAQ